MHFVKRFLALFTVMTCCASAQYVGMLQQPQRHRIKAENGLIISWNDVSNDVDEQQVKLYNQAGRLLTSLAVLRPAQKEARSVSIYDVSARPGGIIAVAGFQVQQILSPSLPTKTSLG
jgi:hypothetical protein